MRVSNMNEIKRISVGLCAVAMMGCSGGAEPIEEQSSGMWFGGGQRLGLLVGNRYRVLEDEHVFDTQQGLIWQKEPNKNRVDWYAAKAYCAHLAPPGGWRLPTIEELKGLVEKSAERANTHLPGMNPWFYWSSSQTYKGKSQDGRAFSVYFRFGVVDSNVVDHFHDSFGVRCVAVAAPEEARVEQGKPPHPPQKDKKAGKGIGLPAGNRYRVREDGHVLDTQQDLIWQKDPNKKWVNWYQAKDSCAELVPKGSWRLPTSEELKSLVDKKAKGPKTELPGMNPWFYWSSSKFYQGNQAPAEHAFGVDFSLGDIQTSDVGLFFDDRGVRCVAVPAQGPS